MCNGNKNCKGCGCGSSNADGASYNPKEMMLYINKHLFEGKADLTLIQEAYPKVMVYLESKNLPFTESSIASNKEALIVAVNDPDFLNKKESTGLKFTWHVAAILGVILLLLWWLTKDDGVSFFSPSEPASTVPAPAPAPTPTPVPTPAPAATPEAV